VAGGVFFTEEGWSVEFTSLLFVGCVRSFQNSCGDNSGYLVLIWTRVYYTIQ
jgi:hypothetical protein